MKDRLRPRIALLSTDPDLLTFFRTEAERVGAELLSPGRPEDCGRVPWDLAAVDGREWAATPGTVARLRGDNTSGRILWLLPTRDPTAGDQALDHGADDLLPPDWTPVQARSRISRLLQHGSLLRRLERTQGDLDGSPAATREDPCRAQSGTDHPDPARRYAELETLSLDLQALVKAQECLIPLRRPGHVEDCIRAALGTLFPGAVSRVEVAGSLAGSEPVPPGRVERGPGSDQWTHAVIPLFSGPERFGFLDVRSGNGGGLDQRKLALLEVYAAQASQALHRSLLYEALSVGKDEWERTFDTIADCISIIGTDFRIRRANRALAATFGKSPKEIVGHTCHRAFYRRDAPCPDCPVRQTFATGSETQRKEGFERAGREYDFRAYPLTDDTGTTYAAIAYARDVSLERRLARSLPQSERLMSLGQIAAGIAHEINNPLTAASSYAQLLVLRLEDPKLVESAQHIQQNVERIHKLVANLTSFVRPGDEGHYPLDLNQIVADTLSFSRYEVTRGETELVEQLAADLPRVLGSKEQLEHLLVNLLTNARDAVAGRGRIVVRTSRQGDTVSLAVEDDGVGIQDRDLERVFEPFFTTKPAGKGTGLGLFVALGIARKHGGTLTAGRRPGRGTRLQLTLPVFRT